MRDAKFQTRQGGPDATGRRFGIVASRFHGDLVGRLAEGARAALLECGVAADDLTSVEVPGAWELPLALDRVAASGEYDGLVALGVVIRGDTPHFDYVCSGCAQGVQRVSLDRGIPIGFGVLTCDTRDQAVARAGGDEGNKGREAALAALEMADLLDRVSRPGTGDASRRSGRAS